MNVSQSGMRGCREGLMAMSSSLIAQDSTFKLILCPVFCELWKYSLVRAVAGGNEHGIQEHNPNQPGRICKKR